MIRGYVGVRYGADTPFPEIDVRFADGSHRKVPVDISWQHPFSGAFEFRYPFDFESVPVAAAVTFQETDRGGGMRFLEICREGERYVPDRILRTRGSVVRAEALLSDDDESAGFGRLREAIRRERNLGRLLPLRATVEMSLRKD